MRAPGFFLLYLKIDIKTKLVEITHNEEPLIIFISVSFLPDYPISCPEIKIEYNKGFRLIFLFYNYYY